ncbi:TM0106 family RecB-like putative nuclease [Rhodococcus sp. G-MC3]|uniref:TM0106 family RecB-like putative nuclease n=1 Tax=Rhodococcus sp. G-MC3 TaxID=3046209 RepID=UPI0024BBE33F|nr:TM0106 family RecB-like putative nuclease [Rhodococcus sp. G-MC3]MDJ0396331.1 TM0106 family RecB-like putative nuclease [Rhodococcus sp. G-MC3]
MFLSNERVVYSASDLSAAASCEYALLRTLDAKLGRIERVREEPDPMLERTSALGLAHERRQLEAFQSTFGQGVSVMERPERTLQGLTDANAATIETALWGYDVLYQATFFDGRFLGYCDFLVKEGHGYSVYDTKLSRHARVPALLQLAAYADALERSGIEVADHLHLMLGDGSTTDHATKNLLPVYRRRRAHLENLLDEHMTDVEPARWGDSRFTACGRCEHCEQQVLAHDDLLLVAGLSRGHRSHLIEAGITTTTALAAGGGPVENISARILGNLQSQATLQIAQKASGRTEYEIFDADALGALPVPDPGDIFFDFEGDPLWAEPGSSEWGIEYLFGVLETDNTFKPFWAHDRAQERAALAAFLDYIVERRKQFPGMHVYHYAAYEKTALLRLAGRYGVGEEIVDNLLRDNVLVDLYPVVKGSLRIGARSYSIKKLEPLYMPTGRDGEVTNAAASIVEYANWCDLRDQGRTEEADALLGAIADYNRYDCVSTLRLRDWLHAMASEHGVELRPPADIAADIEDETSPLEDSLREFVGIGPVSERTDVQQSVALYAGSIGYHRRERKPFWWAHFDRLQSPVDEWAEASDVWKVDSGLIETEWAKTTPRQKLLRRRLRLTGTGGVGKSVRLLYDVPAPDGLDQPHPSYRASSRGDVAEVGDDYVIVEEKLAADAEQYVTLPIALAPDAPIRTASLEEAIGHAAQEVGSTLPELPRTSVADLTSLSAPRTISGGPLPAVAEDNYAAAITAALLDLDSSYLAVQGPPGTGKTYTAARVIAGLVHDHHWRIGVVAQSHSVVDNLLQGIAKAGVDAALIGKKKPTELTELRDTEYPGFVAGASAGCVIGGTAWDFSHSTRVVPGSLDLLVIDEAGQFSLANTIAVASSARNLLLLGDPQQLPQVSQGTHPEPVDESALGWLAAGHGALPADRGYFLSRTWRMHPDLCAPVSALSYEGKLFSNEAATLSRSLEGLDAGLHSIVVDHHDNTTVSPEEADEILHRILGLVGLPWTNPDTHDGVRPLEPSDFLVVAPYNAQVDLIKDLLRRKGLEDVLVGTVDKFQGRQAPVAIVSMTASNLGDSPRGASFLLSRNRLNVAISRGQWAALLVQARTLTHYLPATPDGLETLGAFMALTEESAGHRESTDQPNALPSPR